VGTEAREIRLSEVGDELYRIDGEGQDVYEDNDDEDGE
jgi:hypothetical protein